MTDTTLSVLTERLQLPAIGAPMFLISNPDLVIAQCKAGIIGTFPALNARPSSVLEEWLIKITAELAAYNEENPNQPAAPFAVNLIVHKSNPRLEEDLALCVKFKVPLVVTSLGAREDVNSAIRGYGGIVLHDVINNRFARKAIEKGASGLIAVAAGAGGHAGVTSPFALVREIREWFDGPLALSGAISHGASILAALACGADLAYMGSVFIATEEANASEAYKQMILDCSAKDILYTNQFTGVHGNYLIPSIIAAGLDPENLPGSDPSAMDFADSDSSGAKAWRDIWGAGQGIGILHEKTSTAEVIARLKAELISARQRLA